MGATRFTELKAWQLSHQLMMEVDDSILANPVVRQDRKFFEQLSDSVRSAPRNLAEGFGRYNHREFAQFARIARSSLTETQNHLLDARGRRFVDGKVFDGLWDLSDHALATTTALLKYLTRRRRPNEGRA